MHVFSAEQKMRYHRHLILDGFGADAQNRLLHSRVLVVGVGGLGSPVAMYLAAAGVGTIGIVDADRVSVSNLQRQILYDKDDVGQLKTEVAERKLKAMNPDVAVVRHDVFLSQENAMELIRPYDFVVVGTDNFASKYLVNDVCVMLDKDFSIAGIHHYGGQMMTHQRGTACYRCIFPEPPDAEDVESTTSVGVFGPLAGMVGTVQAAEAVKCLTGIGRPLVDTLLTVDALTLQWMRLDINRDSQCALCGSAPTITSLLENVYMP